MTHTLIIEQTTPATDPLGPHFTGTCSGCSWQCGGSEAGVQKAHGEHVERMRMHDPVAYRVVIDDKVFIVPAAAVTALYETKVG